MQILHLQNLETVAIAPFQKGAMEAVVIVIKNKLTVTL